MLLARSLTPHLDAIRAHPQEPSAAQGPHVHAALALMQFVQGSEVEACRDAPFAVAPEPSQRSGKALSRLESQSEWKPAHFRRRQGPASTDSAGYAYFGLSD